MQIWTVNMETCFQVVLLTFIAKSSFKSRETVTLACHMMTRAVTVYALGTRLTAAVPEVTWRTDCGDIWINIRKHQHNLMC